MERTVSSSLGSLGTLQESKQMAQLHLLYALLQLLCLQDNGSLRPAVYKHQYAFKSGSQAYEKALYFILICEAALNKVHCC